METSLFRTRTEYIPSLNKKKKGYWEAAVDIGYSGVKVFSPNVIATFPSYAVKVDKNFGFIGETPQNAVLYHSLDTDEYWLVGAAAENSINSRDTAANDSNILYSRDRYNSPLFRVLVEAGLGITCMSNEKMQFNQQDELVVQTGLPEKYLSEDSEYMKDVFEGTHRFTVKIGSRSEQKFSLSIARKNVNIMSQPKGTLFSICTLSDGMFHRDAKRYLSSSIMVIDGGFGTLDIFPIRSGIVQEGETYGDLGMRRVLEETSKEIRQKYNVYVPVPAMQKALETGKVKFTDRKKFISRDYPFGELLEKAERDVFEEAVSRINNAFDLSEYSYIVVTGGTGEAWLPLIRDRFKDFEGMQVLSGNQNDGLSFIYSNVRGYYYYRYNRIGRG